MITGGGGASSSANTKVAACCGAKHAMSGGGGASFAYSDTALKFVCSVNVLGSGSTLLFGNNVLSVFQSTVGLIFSLEGYNAVRRRSITRLRDAGKPVVASMGGVAASGGCVTFCYDRVCRPPASIRLNSPQLPPRSVVSFS
jgi:hypothetical protein